MTDDAAFVKRLVAEICPEVLNWRAPNKKGLRVAIIGFGKMGLLHSGILNLLVPGALRSVVDKSLLLTLGASRIIGAVKFYRDLDKMLEEIEPEVVYVTTPTPSHYPILRNLIERGVKYIFVEKPPTVNSEQLKQLISIKRADQHVMVGLQKRYALPFRHAKLLIDNEAIGDPRFIRASIRSGDVQGPTTRFDDLGRGALLDLGIHLLDLLMWFFEVKHVTQAEGRSIYTKVDDVFRAELVAEDGAKVSIEVTWSDPEHRVPETYMEIEGSRGTIRVTEDYLKVKAEKEHQLMNNKKEMVLYKPYYYQGIPPVNLADPEYTIENMHFLRCIHEGLEPLTSIESALKVMELVDSLYERAKRST